ncbi:Hsp20 family protein [Novosphingobium guangzhouense]|uniref:Molecular chaperone n=1 Tax=Novosphingobium guangzhouense TaxID=1850347 RepID=A0A2K2FVF1_9SPHN|nr:Hsp20 family protein [Novosphingobium guangzhouense]PNU02756.1 molecular chaperone [Novosphingobium guangzhouense]
MRPTFDFTPYRRSTVGFDRLFNLLEAGAREDEGYPPFDIERLDDDNFRITVAVVGFKPEDIEIVAQQNLLTVTGKHVGDANKGEYLHRGITTRAFERRFQLADFIEVAKANFEHGLLTIELTRVVPEAMKPRRIEIGGRASGTKRVGELKEQASEVT